MDLSIGIERCNTTLGVVVETNQKQNRYPLLVENGGGFIFRGCVLL
jgi:hypothetical protein